jgi:hypothetical protein
MHGTIDDTGITSGKVDHETLAIFASTFKKKTYTTTKKIDKPFRAFLEKHQNERPLSWNVKLVSPVINKAFLGLTREVMSKACMVQIMHISHDELSLFNCALFSPIDDENLSAIETCQKNSREDATETPKDQNARVDLKVIATYKIESWAQVIQTIANLVAFLHVVSHGDKTFINKLFVCCLKDFSSK